MILSAAVALSLLSSPADAKEVHWWVVRNKVAIGSTARQPAASAEAACDGLSRADARTCQSLAAHASEALAADRALNARLSEEGVIFSSGGLMLIGGTSQGYGDILINSEPFEFE